MDNNGSDDIIKISGNNEAIEIKIRTMFCCQTPTLRIDKHVRVGALKERVTLVTGVLAEHQRLIFRGKALSDDKLVSDYHVEDGDILHLIVITTSEHHHLNNRASTTNLSEQLRIITQMVSALVLSIGNLQRRNEWTPPSVAPEILDRHMRRAALLDAYMLHQHCDLSAQRQAASHLRDQTRAVSLGNSNMYRPSSHHTFTQLPMPNRRGAFWDMRMLQFDGLGAHRWAATRLGEQIASLNVGNRGSSSSMDPPHRTSAQLPMPNPPDGGLGGHRRASRLLREQIDSLNVGNRGSSSSWHSWDQPDAFLMNPPHVSLGNSNISHYTSAQLPMPNNAGAHRRRRARARRLMRELRAAAANVENRGSSSS